MKVTRLVGVGVLVSLLAVCTANATNWNQDVPVGATWGDAANWNGGIPATNNSAIIISTQANTYDIKVNSAVPATRLIQVGQEYSFTGTGQLSIERTLGTQWDNLMYNTTSGGTVTYNVPLTITTHNVSTYYGQMNNNHGGTTVFNDAFTLSSGSKLNADGGTFIFNGDLNIDGSLRLGATKMTIGGTGTTTMNTDYILTSTSGSELHLNRTGAYIPKAGSGYLRVEKSKVYFNAPQAVGTGTTVKMYEADATSALVSGGDYDQEFGLLYCSSTANDAIIDMQNSACMWTFADCSGLGWGAPGVGLAVINVDTNNTVIRFKIDGGTGLTSTQIDRTTVNGIALTNWGTTVESGYLYITPATSVSNHNIMQPSIVSSSMVSGNVMKLVVDAPSDASRYWPEGVSDLVSGSWATVAHSDDGVNAFVVTNLAYSTAEGSNEVIYVQAVNPAGFFKVVGE